MSKALDKLLANIEKADELAKVENPDCYIDVGFEGRLTDQVAFISLANKHTNKRPEPISVVTNHTEGKSDLDKVFERMNQDLSKWIEKMKERLQDD